MRRAFVAVCCALLGGCSLIQPSRNAHVPQPAKSVDLSRYLGRWYEMARYDSSFEHDCNGVTADYALLPSGMIRVVNTCHHPSGATETAKGRAYAVPDTGNAKLKVSFFGPFFGNYWVLDHADDYSWSIVGEGSGGYLWILTRAQHPAAAERAFLIARVDSLGYSTVKLHTTQQ